MMKTSLFIYLFLGLITLGLFATRSIAILSAIGEKLYETSRALWADVGAAIRQRHVWFRHIGRAYRYAILELHLPSCTARSFPTCFAALILVGCTMSNFVDCGLRIKVIKSPHNLKRIDRIWSTRVSCFRCRLSLRRCRNARRYGRTCLGFHTSAEGSRGCAPALGFSLG